MAGTLVATRYVPPGSYIGQLITPRPGQVAPEARLPCFIGRGSRLALGTNIPITRSFIFAESLTFSTVAPFVATLSWNSDGDQQGARLFKADGTEVRRDQWSFQDTGSGSNNQVLINTEVFDATSTYQLDYQSTDRAVTDTVPVEELREVVNLGNQVDKPQYLEYTHFFLETAVSTVAADSGNTNPDPSVSVITADGGNTGGSDPTFASSAAYSHNYSRSYEVEVTAQTVGTQATGTITAVGGANLIDGETFVINDGVNPAITFEFNTGTPTAGNVLVSYGAGDPAGTVATAIQGAINGVGSTLLVTAQAPVAAVVTVNADNFGTAANQTITETVVDAGFTVTGLATGAARVVTCDWSADAVSAGNANGFDNPLHSSGTKPAFTASDDVAGSLTPLLEYGLRLEFDFGATGTPPFDVGDTWTFWANGPGLFEPDIRHANTNQFATIADPVADAGNTGTTGTDLSVATTAAFTGTYNARYQLEVTAVTNTAPGTRDVTFIWGEAGDHVGINGTFTADEATPATLTQTLSKGVVLDVDYPVGAGNFAVGDIFTVTASAPRQLYQSKDSRTYTMTVSGATNPAAGEGFVQGTFVTDTPEGGFGTFEATANDKLVTDPDFEDGHFSLPNNVLMVARNLFYDGLTSGNQHAAADAQTFAATQAGTINWTLNARTDETVEADEILTDVNGTVTGTPNTPYVILSWTPLQVNSVVTLVGSNPVSYTAIADTPYVTFVTDPGEAVVINYDWRSAEPDPGQTYFLTAKFLRPAESYNTPTLILDRQDGRNALAPASLDNHLYVMNEIAWDNGVPGLYYVQVQDPDEDGVYTNADFNEAIIASEAPRRITDITVLSQFGSLGSALNSVSRMNDPFERRERLLWVGTPVGTPIGDAETPDTIVYTARNTLQVFGNNPAHGTRIIVGSTQATKEIRLDDGSTVIATLDGSFVAGAVASLVASFQDPGETILRRTLGGFDTLETYGDIEDPRNLTLGAGQVLFFTDQGGGVFRIEEDVTVDTFADDFKNINAMTQKQFVVRNIRSQVDSSLVGIVVPSAQAGIGLVKGFVVGAVNTLVTRGIVGRYQDSAGNERTIDPDADVVVFRDDTDPTLYHFFFAFWLKTVIKRLFGLYSVNSNDFGILRG
jgi:hypothetical protein